MAFIYKIANKVVLEPPNSPRPTCLGGRLVGKEHQFRFPNFPRVRFAPERSLCRHPRYTPSQGYCVDENHQSRSLQCPGHKDKYGVAPLAALPGDVIVVLLGCTSPIVLRPCSERSHRVVGDAYYDGTMYGQAILSYLPEGCLSVKQLDATSKSFHWAYRNDDTCEMLLDDPRVPELPSDWKRVSHDKDWLYRLFRHKGTGIARSIWEDSRCELDDLEKRDIQLEEFMLVGSFTPRQDTSRN